MLKKKIAGAWRSLTIWVNAVALAAIPAVQYASDHIEDVRALVGPDSFKVITGLLVVANIALRFRTSMALEDKAR